MNDYGIIMQKGHIDLLFKRPGLLRLESLVPVEIEADFTHSSKFPLLQPLFNNSQFVFVVLFYRSWMQAHHRNAYSWKASLHRQQSRMCAAVDCREIKFVNIFLLSTLNHRGKVFDKV